MIIVTIAGDHRLMLGETDFHASLWMAGGSRMLPAVASCECASMFESVRKALSTLRRRIDFYLSCVGLFALEHVFQSLLD